MKLPYVLVSCMAALLATSPVLSGQDGIEEDIEVRLNLDFTGPDGFGDFSMSEIVVATQILSEDGEYELEFLIDEGNFTTSGSAYVLTFQELDVCLEQDGEFEAEAIGRLFESSFTDEFSSGELEMNSAGSFWDGAYASGTGTIDLDDFGDFDGGYDFNWNIEVVPAPGILALCGLVGLVRCRRRD